ncbi:MAG: hypothetical protein G01um101470_161 [Parcubacteria group bacterium Gr01-1014_70]|nr:MAG: hypothetical protein G01um101470_161 [Parcubacteria group bacterium Gr01-1014_70]
MGASETWTPSTEMENAKEQQKKHIPSVTDPSALENQQPESLPEHPVSNPLKFAPVKKEANSFSLSLINQQKYNLVSKYLRDVANLAVKSYSSADEEEIAREVVLLLEELMIIRLKMETIGIDVATNKILHTGMLLREKLDLLKSPSEFVTRLENLLQSDYLKEEERSTIQELCGEIIKLLKTNATSSEAIRGSRVLPLRQSILSRRDFFKFFKWSSGPTH